MAKRYADRSAAPVGYVDPYQEGRPKLPTIEEIDTFWRDLDELRERPGLAQEIVAPEQKVEVVIPVGLEGMPHDVAKRLAAHPYIAFLPPALDYGISKDDLAIEAGLVLEGTVGWFTTAEERMPPPEYDSDDEDQEEVVVDPQALFMEAQDEDLANIIEDYGRIDLTFDDNNRVTSWRFYWSSSLVQ
jgi:hypothetical protein